MANGISTYSTIGQRMREAPVQKMSLCLCSALSKNWAAMPSSNALQITQFANFAVNLMPTLPEKQKAQIINGYWKHCILSILTLVNSWKGQLCSKKQRK